MNTTWLAVLSSSLLTSVMMAVITGLFVLRAKKSEYINQHFKALVQRRLNAYDEIELAINDLKTTVLGEDQRPYHQPFATEESWAKVCLMLMNATAHPLWLSNDIFARLRELNKMVFQASANDRGMIDFGQANYRAIALLREEIEMLHARDMLDLHNVKKFLKSKQKRVGFEQFDTRDGMG